MKKSKTTKTIILTAVLAVGALFISCKKDDNSIAKKDDNSIAKKSDTTNIVGTWKLTSNTEELFKNDVSTKKTKTTIDDDNYEILTLSSDKTYTSKSSYSSLDSKGVKKVTLSNFKATYTIKGNILTVTHKNDTGEFTFKLSNNTLTLILITTGSDGGDSKDVITAVYSRQ